MVQSISKPKVHKFGSKTVELGDQFREFKLQLAPTENLLKARFKKDLTEDAETGDDDSAEAVAEETADTTSMEVLRFSVASEEPYARWWGTEILSLEDGACDLIRLASGRAMFLYNHDRSAYLAVIERAWIENAKLYIECRFASHALARQVYRDIKEGILTCTSIGYEILDWREVAPDEYRIVSWCPLEASIVTIPADATVGYGRSVDRDLTPSPIPLGNTESNSDPKPNVTITAQERTMSGIAPVLTREEEITEIRAMGDASKVPAKLIEVFIDAGCSVAEARHGIVEFRSKQLQTPIDGFNALGLSDKEQKRYSLSRGLLAQLDGKLEKDAPFEHECHRELEKVAEKANIKNRGGLLIPLADIRSRLDVNDPRTGLPVLQRDKYQATSTDAVGGALIYTEGAPLIELLRPLTMVMRLGPRMLTGLVSNIQIPRQISGSTGYWIAEDDNTTESEATFDFISLAPKTAASLSVYTRQFLLQATQIPSVEEFVRTDLMLGMAQTIDVAAISGAGSGGVPLGILNLSGVNSVIGGTNGAAPTWASIVSFKTKVSNSNANMLPGKAWLINPSVEGTLRTTPKVAQHPEYIYNDGPDPEVGRILGYPAYCSNNVPSNLTKGTGTNLSAAVFGAWSEMIVGMWSIMEMMADPYTKFASGGIRVRAFQSIDLQYRHAKAFAIQTDLITT